MVGWGFRQASHASRFRQAYRRSVPAVAHINSLRAISSYCTSCNWGHAIAAETPSQALSNRLVNKTLGLHNHSEANMSSNGKVTVNGATSASDPNIQSQITTALLQNGGVGRIQSTLRQQLDEAGWSENLRNYITQLFRSGECTTYFEAREKAMRYIVFEGEEGDKMANGNGQAPHLTIPRSAAEGGAEAVKKELHSICEMK